MRSGSLTGLAVAASLLLVPAAGTAASDPHLQLDAWLGAGALDFDYRESDSGVVLDREEGVLPGLNAGLRLAQGALFAEGELRVAGGHVDYRSATVTTRTDETILDTDLIAGYTPYVRDRASLALYAGLGYRHWQRDIRSTATASGLDETYRWGYGSLGVRATRAVGARGQLRADLRLTRTLAPEITIDYTAGYDTQTLQPGGENGLRAAIGYEHRVRDGISLFVSPWYEYWKLGRSDTGLLLQNGIPVGTVFEPRSTTRNLGINAGVRWRVF
jgi:hypothetical protein